ncbi:hypothetical protein B0H13DRAFT_1856338 [Mycena leptocephala]|nr:hypothetical protein B0H13DRAFT_1856338 [Mycena leptocephala]
MLNVPDKKQHRLILGSSAPSVSKRAITQWLRWHIFCKQQHNWSPICSIGGGCVCIIFEEEAQAWRRIAKQREWQQHRPLLALLMLQILRHDVELGNGWQKVRKGHYIGQHEDFETSEMLKLMAMSDKSHRSSHPAFQKICYFQLPNGLLFWCILSVNIVLSNFCILLCFCWIHDDLKNTNEAKSHSRYLRKVRTVSGIKKEHPCGLQSSFSALHFIRRFERKARKCWDPNLRFRFCIREKRSRA